ncbi:MAG: IS200/IS605 family transposase [Ignavibacteria bacterium]|nr:IS200/IS605 family transposase [Ignavibacteria bacterium]
MSHSLLKIWIHGIFGTKDRTSLIKNTFEAQLHSHIKEKLERELDCKVRIINGTEDHVHILFLLSPNFTMKDIFHNVKGESSHWVNQSDFIKYKFAWQTGYGAFSVSESMVKEVEKYIANQKEHHKKMTYEEEIDLFIKKYGLKIINPALPAGRR